MEWSGGGRGGGSVGEGGKVISDQVSGRMLTTTGKLSRTGPWPMASLGQHDKWQTRIDRPPIKVLVGRRMFFMTRNEHPECLLV